MKIFITLSSFQDNSSIEWQEYFYNYIKKKYKYQIRLIVFKNINNYQNILNIIDNEYEIGDFMINRIGGRDVKLFNKLYIFLHSKFKNNIFPRYDIYKYYDKKNLQHELFIKKKYSYPISQICKNKNMLNDFKNKNNLSYPLIHKLYSGAGSSNISKIFNNNCSFPCIIQEFIEKNDYDIRIVTIDNIIYGIQRNNRLNDWRASGSGLIVLVDSLPIECVKFAYQISNENNFECMAYDFIYDYNKNKYLCLEFSYTFSFSVSSSYINYYYDANNSFNKITLNNPIRAQDFIIDNLLKSTL